MITVDQLKPYLMKMTDEESIYKKIYELRKEPDKFKEYMLNLDRKALLNQGIWLPKPSEEAGGWNFPEYLISNETQNIDVSKHNRYNPLFYHGHDFFEMIYIYEGKCENTVEELPGKFVKMNMEKDDICILAPGIKHTMGVYDDDSIVINIIIRQSTFKRIFFNLLTHKNPLSFFFYNTFYSDNPNSYIYFKTKDDQELHRVFENLIVECINKREYFTENSENLLRSVFFYLLRNHAKDAILPNSPFKAPIFIYDILAFIQEHYNTVTLRQLSYKFNYSEQYLCKLIKKHTGSTFNRILEDIRFAKCASMLESSNLPISEICKLVGFKSVEYFTRRFKKLYNMTPTEYRKSKSFQ